jgi:hypothetical protein
MNTNDIKKLLDAFYNGETDAGESRILTEYFTGNNVAGELMDERELFLSIHQGDPVEVPSSLESKLNDLVDELADKERKGETKPLHGRRRMWTWIGSAAAGVAILVSAGLFFNDKPGSEPVIRTETLSDKDKQTVKEAEDALMLLSGKFNKGVNQLAVVSSNIDKTNDILNKTFNRKQNKES